MIKLNLKVKATFFMPRINFRWIGRRLDFRGNLAKINITIYIHVFKMCTIHIALTILFQKYFPTKTKRNNLDEKNHHQNIKINVIRKTMTY